MNFKFTNNSGDISVTDATKSIVLLVLSICFLWIVTGPAMTLGEIWERRAHPMQNVTVKIGGNLYTGSLSREWSGDLSLYTDEGLLIFQRDRIEYMTSKLDFEAMKNRSAFFSWRLLLPASIAMSIYLLTLMYTCGLINRTIVRNQSN